MYVGQHRLMDSPRTFQICLLFLWHKGSRLTDWDPQHYTHWFKLCRTLWVRNYPHFWLLPHNSSSLGGNAMKFYDFVSEGLIPVLTTIGVFGWINIRVNKQQSCIKPSVCRGCEHTHTLTVELLHAICRGCGGTHALQRSETCPLCNVHRGCGGTHALQRSETCPLCNVHRGCGGTHALLRSEICPLRAIRCGCGGTHAFWRAGVESFPCVLALSAVILLRSFTGTAPCSCFFGDWFWWKFQVICCLQLIWGYSVLFRFIILFIVIRYIFYIFSFGKQDIWHGSSWPSSGYFVCSCA